MAADDGKFVSGFKDGFVFVLGGANRFSMGGFVGIAVALSLAFAVLGGAIALAVYVVNLLT